MKSYLLLCVALLSFLASSFQLRAASEGEIVLNSCEEADLRAAFLTHRTVRFTSDCVITLTSPLIVTSEKVLDAAGHSVVLSGGNSNRLFEVQTNASLSLIHLTIANG